LLLYYVRLSHILLNTVLLCYCVTMLNPSHTTLGMSRNAVGININLLRILGQSKCILNIRTELRLHSKYSGTFLRPVGMFCACSKLSRCIRSRKHRTAFEVYSNCILKSRTAFEQHSNHSGRIRGRIETPFSY